MLVVIEEQKILPERVLSQLPSELFHRWNEIVVERKDTKAKLVCRIHCFDLDVERALLRLGPVKLQTIDSIDTVSSLLESLDARTSELYDPDKAVVYLESVVLLTSLLFVAQQEMNQTTSIGILSLKMDY